MKKFRDNKEIVTIEEGLHRYKIKNTYPNINQEENERRLKEIALKLYTVIRYPLT